MGPRIARFLATAWWTLTPFGTNLRVGTMRYNQVLPQLRKRTRTHLRSHKNRTCGMNQKLIGIVVVALSCCAQTASLGPNFAGSDIRDIISGLNSSKDKWKRSEFEKATEYAARI